ncbi:MAG: putative dehydrogenase, partial [Pirellulaceae bacterium]
MKRRTFLAATATALAAPQRLAEFGLFAASKGQLRVGVIGHTGRGDFGHGLDTVWMKLSSTDIVAVADANEAGLAAAKKKLNTSKGFSDYREMLKAENLDVVAICPRHADQHHEMAMATIDAGVRGIYMEKPFVRTPGEADGIVDACKKHNVKLAIAHRNRYHPVLKTIDKFIADG